MYFDQIHPQFLLDPFTNLPLLPTLSPPLRIKLPIDSNFAVHIFLCGGFIHLEHCWPARSHTLKETESLFPRRHHLSVPSQLGGCGIPSHSMLECSLTGSRALCRKPQLLKWTHKSSGPVISGGHCPTPFCPDFWFSRSAYPLSLVGPWALGHVI